MQMILTSWNFTGWLTGRRCQPKPVQIRRRHELARRKVLTMVVPEGGAIRCVQGCIWITRDGDTEDILLRGGESFACGDGKRVVIEALEVAVVEIK